MELKYKSYLIYNNSNELDDNSNWNFNINHIGIQNLSSSATCSFIITYSMQKNNTTQQQEQRIIIPPKENWEIGLETEEPLDIYFLNIKGSIYSEESQDTLSEEPQNASSGTSKDTPIGICYFSYWED